VDRRDRSGIASFFRAEPCAAGDTIDLAGDALAHALVRRIETGDAIRLVDGLGTVAVGSVVDVTRRQVRVNVGSVEHVRQPSPLEILVPVADRDRMLWAAEKCVELQVTAWGPVRWARSQSVAGRGAGERFAERVVSRMRSALEQSGGAWLPTVRPEAGAGDALRNVPAGHQRILLAAAGDPLTTVLHEGGVSLAVGPEGGLETRELEEAVANGWVLASLGPSMLRFETAIIAGAAVVRAAQHSTREV
jgi:16S rRNA (uracil1498-N3)-methyltransferase